MVLISVVAKVLKMLGKKLLGCLGLGLGYFLTSVESKLIKTYKCSCEQAQKTSEEEEKKS